MTTSTILSAISFGTSTNVGPFFNPVETALQATTSCVKIACKVTRGSGNVQAGSKVRIWHAVTPTDYSTAALGARALRPGAEYVEIDLAAISGDGPLELERSSDILVTAAGHHHCWFDAPTLTEAATLTVSLQELP